MTLTVLPFAAVTTLSISSLTSLKRLSFNAPILITISISLAPFSMAFFVSNAFTSLVDAPSGKPMTVHTNTSVPFNCSAEYSTCVGLTQIDLKPYSLASLIILSICSRVDSGFNCVWSIYFA
ncbi:Uncharacterised protein [Streptococcus pneumoniae]|nr:Uncharacterised protein [Streptococcus pneumoniae]